MWFRRKNKPDSDHSVLSNTLVSLQGLLDEKPVPHKPTQTRLEPTLSPASTDATTADESARDDDIEPEITEVRDMLMAADQTSDDSKVTSPQASSHDTKKKNDGSSWANLDLDFDEVESTAVMPAVTDEVPDATPTLDSELEPDEEIEAAPPPEADDPLEAPAEDNIAPESDSTDDKNESGTTTTLFDVIPTLNEVVFDPDADGSAASKLAEPEVEPVVLEAEPVEPEVEPVEFEAIPAEPEPTPVEEPSPVIVPGVSSTQTVAHEPRPNLDAAEDIELPLPIVPLSPSEFTEFVLQRIDIAYHEQLREELPAPFREAARGILLDSIQQWIAQARQVLQKKQ